MHIFKDYFDALKIPPGWVVRAFRLDGAMWWSPKKKMSVIASIDKEADSRDWLHLSIASLTRLPSYTDLQYLKRHWAGGEAKAIMVFPPDEEHVNFHPNALHLFVCLTEDILPDFTRGEGLI